jgi:hypothetical protein
MHKPPSRWFHLEGRLHRLYKMKETMPPKWPDVSLFLYTSAESQPRKRFPSAFGGMILRILSHCQWQHYVT